MMTALTSALGLVPLALAAGQPGKDLLYPIATVVIGGMFTSTLLEFFVRPALFWTFGRKAAEKVVLQTRSKAAALSEAEEANHCGVTETHSHENEEIHDAL
jgi:hypothetical protein